MNIISLGAGVQSSTMALMAARGEITPMPDAAIFADTQWEPRGVYDWLKYLRSIITQFPIYEVTAGNLRQAALDRSNTTGGRFAVIPWFIEMPNGKKAMGRRQCTKEYKLRPVQRKIVELHGGERKRSQCSLWIGISTDEAGRMKPSQVQYIENRWPLIEIGMSRRDCLAWMKANGFLEPPRSSCIGCPFHGAVEWNRIQNDAVSWADAVEVDAAIRTQPGSKGRQYMHRKLIPLSEIDFSTDEERGQGNMFMNECEGMCGV